MTGLRLAARYWSSSMDVNLAADVLENLVDIKPVTRRVSERALNHAMMTSPCAK